MDHAYTTAVLQSGNNIVFVAGSKRSKSHIVNDDGKSWPAIKIVLNMGAEFAEELEVEALR